jgi:L-glyceraldehyde 3-phosphate reductase
MGYSALENRYQNMIYRRCGMSGIRLPVLSLGLWHNFGGVDRLENGREIIYRAFDSGITHFDLANNYGPPAGSAEENFGRVLLDMHSYRNEMFISTKAGYYMWPGPYGEWGSRKYLLSSLEDSLKRLHLETVDIFYSHRYDPDTPLEETMGALHSAVRQGKALYAGISNYPPAQTAEAAELLEEMGTPCLIHQPKYNMFHREPEQDLLAVLEDYGMGCICFSPLAQGLLTDRYLNEIPQDSRMAKEHGFLTKDRLTQESLDKIRALNTVAADRGQTLAQLALTWVLRDKRITSVVIGVSKIEQLEQNLKILDAPELTDEEQKIIDNILTDNE